jgi:hypothetical protein
MDVARVSVEVRVAYLTTFVVLQGQDIETGPAPKSQNGFLSIR